MPKSGSRFIFRFSIFIICWTMAAAWTAICVAPMAQAQTQSTPATKNKTNSSIDISVGVFGQLTPTRTPTDSVTDSFGTVYTQTIQGTSASAGVLGTFHQSFGRWLGYGVNFGYTRFSEKYSQGIVFIPNPHYVPVLSPTSNFTRGSIGTNMYELTGAYLVQGPKAKRIDTFAQLGGGVLSFLPAKDPSPYSVQFRPTMVFGAGMNYQLSKHWALRAEYRGLFLKNPDFNRGGSGSVLTSKLFTVTNEPTLSIVYRFGAKR